jgi:hypothetical protein
MADYLLVHDRGLFEGQLRPALAEAWKRRAFAPFLPLAHTLVPAALAYAERYHVNPDDLLLPRVESLRFDRPLWRALVGEVLFVTAVEIPDLPSHLDPLTHLLPEIGPALHGSRDLTFGLATYRPGHAGLNDASDVIRLSAFLDSVDPGAWSDADLAGLPDLLDEDRAFELEYAREWFAVLADLYRRAAAAGRVVVCESIW